jgi:hypothetical protein
MTETEILQAIEMLKDDKHYFGEFGKKFLSNSKVKTLLTNPLAYEEDTPKTSQLLIGSWWHETLLEPWKNERAISSETSRNSKVYKEEVVANGGEMLLLDKEILPQRKIMEKVKRNELFMELLKGNLKQDELEQPMVKQLFGTWFKAKADRINNTCNIVIDLKTTSDITKFRGSFFTYGYDTQAYIYNQLFGKEVVFLVVDKTTGALGHYSVSDFTLQNAEEKVKRAVEVKELYYGDNATGDTDQIINIDEI